jgi:hypothetical protein
MTNQHSTFTPAEELIAKWEGEWHHHRGQDSYEEFMAKQAARWGADQQLKLDAEQIAQAYQAGADQELEACIEWIANQDWTWTKAQLFAARRPKPPSLKEQALALVNHDFSDQPCLSEEGYAIIRRALEALPE